MGYKVLGFFVWQFAKLYLRHSSGGRTAKIAAAGVGAAIVAGIVVAGRQASSSD